MLSFVLTFLATAGLVVSVPASNQASNTVVDLGYSKYQGSALSNGVSQYVGMRYAAAPLGNLRFRAPADPVTTTGIQDATTVRPVCVGTNQNASAELSDDCLFVNVFAPSRINATSKLPVWFYIHGGGYAVDTNPNINGSNVVAQSGLNVVVVAFNYRVGALGFLASDKVRRDGDLNAGLLDQRKALQWVQKYIHLVLKTPPASSQSNLMQLKDRKQS